MKVTSLILVLLLPWFLEAQQQYYGTRLSNISLSGSESQADLQMLPLHPGDILTVENIRTSIQTLYDTGRYSYVEVDAVSAPDETTSLTFRVRPVFFFSTFRLNPENLLERPLSSYFRLPFGEKFTTSAVDRVVQETTDLLMDEGYFQAVITPSFENDDAAHLTFVTLNAMPGPRAKVGNVNIQGGEQTFTANELEDAFGLEAGDEFSSAKLDKGVAKVRGKFTDLRFLNSKVTTNRMYNASSNTVDLTVMVQPGQFALVQTRGFDISRKKLRELVPIFEEAAVDPDLVEEGRVAITRYMQQEGYFDAVASAETIEVDPQLGNAIQINYAIVAGAKHEIVDVKINGNKYFETDEIRKRIKSKKGEFLSHGVFSADILEEDRRTIEAMYRNAGFEGTVVEAMPVDVEHQITVLFQIQEGKRLPIDSIEIAGNSHVSTDELRAAFELQEGDTYSPADVDQARAELTQYYFSRGYADARVERTVERNTNNSGVRVKFQITEGEPYLIGSILVAGNTLTKDKVIRRISGLKEYTPYNPEAVLEAQQSLYGTGLFSRVEIVALNQGQPGTRNILIQVEDAKPILLTYGVGFNEFEHLRGLFEVSHNNLFGLNRSISFRSRASRRELLGQATYHEPRLFNHDLDWFASSFYQHSERPFFSADRVDFSLQVLKRFSNKNNLLGTASFQRVNIGDKSVNPHAVDDPRQQGPCQICKIGRVGISLIRDRRNDPINPSTGIFTTSTFQVANRVFGSQLDFTSLFHQTNLYFPFGSKVLATSVRFGWNHPYGPTAQFAPGQVQQLPASERYWAGGSTTLRGFSLDEAHPPPFPDDQGNPVSLEGGNSTTIGNIEYRFPLKKFPIENISGALFYDTGNVFQHLASIRLRDFTHTAGFGLRYKTPVGPARLDLGVNLNPKLRPDGTPEPRVKVFFTLGNPF